MHLKIIKTETKIFLKRNIHLYGTDRKSVNQKKNVHTTHGTTVVNRNHVSETDVQ